MTRTRVAFTAAVVLGMSFGLAAQGLSDRAAAAVNEARHQFLEDAGLGHLSDEDGLKVVTLIARLERRDDDRTRALSEAESYLKSDGYQLIRIERRRENGRDILIVGDDPRARDFTELPSLSFFPDWPAWRDGLHFAKRGWRGLTEVIDTNGRVYRFSPLTTWTPYVGR
jgi:hypothetical protein